MNNQPFNNIKTDNDTNNHFISGIKENNSAILKEIYATFSQQVVKLIVHNGGQEQDAKDVFQDVLISIYRQAHNGLKINCQFSTFFMMACKRRWINVLNSKYISKTTKVDDSLSNILSINDDVNQLYIMDEKMNLVNEKLKMLDPSCKEIIEYSWEKDEQGKYLSWNIIAEKLNMSYGYTRKKAAECKKRLIELTQKDHRYFELK
ncbi:MAG: sigma-70 family RNA polymerase sigma factor [Saprospiraceae bacterium]|nr:sigma-70 family RNA polymerase sigma factor [Saprospiraceae bacterium]